MKKFTFILVAVMMLLTAVAVTPAQAFSGVRGRVVDGEGNPWTYGGTVTIYGDVGGSYQPVGTGTLNTTSGVFNIGYTSAPDLFTTVYILIEYNAGPGGEPGTTQIEFTELSSNNPYNAGDIDTGTGPTAITLQGINAAATGAPAVLAGVTLMLLAGATVLVLRRRVVA